MCDVIVANYVFIDFVSCIYKYYFMSLSFLYHEGKYIYTVFYTYLYSYLYQCCLFSHGNFSYCLVTFYFSLKVPLPYLLWSYISGFLYS